jgi:hypothetical protein
MSMEPDEETLVDLCDVLPFFSRKQLRLHDLACLAAASKRVKHACLEFIRLDALEMLAATVTAAGAEAAAVLPAEPAWMQEQTQEYLDFEDPVVDVDSLFEYKYERIAADKQQKLIIAQYMQAVAWLLRTALIVATAAGTAERLLGIPAVPLNIAVELVTAGVSISCKQLLAAADSMVAGVEVWVQAQQQLGLKKDMPEEIFIACCPDLNFRPMVGKVCCCAATCKVVASDRQWHT